MGDDALRIESNQKKVGYMKKNSLANKTTQDLIFCLIVLLVPVVQFLIFYIGVNVNSFVMAFQKYEIDELTGLGKYIWNGFENFKVMFVEIQEGGKFGFALKNSFTAFFWVTLVGMTLSLVFSLYIFKKMPGHGVFRVLLFAPSVLSAIVTVTMYKFFVESAIPVLLNMPDGMGLLSNPDTGMATIIFFNVWISFGTQILMYSGAMNGIDPSITEAAKLDGANPFVEFFQIILPLIFPTIQTFLVTGVASLFISQLNLVAFKGLQAKPEFVTIGYYLFKDAQAATQARMPVLATYGVCLTVIAVPLTLLTRGALEKYGPSIE